MGFLLAAFGKLSAGRRVRSLQRELTRVSSKTQRITRQIANAQKSLQNQKKMELNGITLQSNMQNSGIAGADWANNNGFGNIFNLIQGGDSSISNMSESDKTAYQAYQTAMQNAKLSSSTMIAQAKEQIEEKYEQMEEMMIEPLQQEQESLETEKDSLESQLQLAQEDYKAYKQMEQSEAKNMAPNFTGAA